MLFRSSAATSSVYAHEKKPMRPAQELNAKSLASNSAVSGVYPHLAMFNDEGECGTGAVVPWAGDLWVITYGPHCPVGSTDKLYRIRPDLTQEIFPSSVGGTPANRLIHRETNQLLIGPYVIDGKGNVRVVSPAKMPGRLTGAARHLTDPANKVYVATMETGLYELDMRTLEVNTLIRENGKNDSVIAAFLKRNGKDWPTGWSVAPRTRVSGYHAKGLASGFGQVFVSNNGEDTEDARRNPFVPSGVLAQWNRPGDDWKMIRRCQFTEVTTPDGIYGNEHPETNPIWAMGWDAKSVILAVTTNGLQWAYYRLPKASHSYDGAHGWNTEWPRIRDVGFGDGTLLATMHGTFWRFPKNFSPANSNGIRPISTYLKVIGDFCRWGDKIVFGCDDQTKDEFLGKRGLKKDAPRCARSQSNLWFVKPDELGSFGPPSGEGYVYLNEDVKEGDTSDPYLYAGYESMRFSFTRADGSAVRHELIHEGDWVRVKCLEDAKKASACFRYGPRNCALPALDIKKPYIDVVDDRGNVWSFPNVNGDTNVVCREIATERDLLYVGGVWYEVPAENAGGFAALRPVALADAPVKSLRAERGLMYLNEKAMVIDYLWKNGTAAAAYWLWESRRKSEIKVDIDLPAGNAIIERVEGDNVYLRQDLRDSNLWFYWAFRVKGAAGRRVKFIFTDKRWGGPVGVRGPVVSTDGGKTFSYPLDGKCRTDTFTYTFAKGENDVLFYECHPYVRANWDAFVAKHSSVLGSRFAVDTLCASRKGVDVPRARFGCIDKKPKFRIFMSARHHCSETTASWVLEGVAEAFLADDELGTWLRENVELMMVPFADYDGVQAGDQGKVRKPHDHNRDYSEFLYPETKAITEWIASHAEGRLDMFIDVHCPWIRGRYNEWVYTPWKDPKILPDVAAEKRFSQLLEKLQCGSMRYRAADDLPFGKEWNKGVNYQQGWSAVIWACHKVKGLKIARSYEVPFANANGAVVTPEKCRDLGRDTAKVFRAMLDNVEGASCR